LEKLKVSCRRLTWPIHPVKEVHVIVTSMCNVFLENNEFDDRTEENLKRRRINADILN